MPADVARLRFMPDAKRVFLVIACSPLLPAASPPALFFSA
jgi:hypothetical protein